MVDDEGNLLDTDGKIIDSSNKSKKVQKQAYVENMYYLLHWGLTYEILVDKGQNYPVTYTIGICQSINDGQIRSFMPPDLKVIGKEHI